MQNLLKSIFIVFFPMFAMYALYVGISQIYQGKNILLNIGQIISALTIVILFGGLFIKSQARTKSNLPIHSTFIAIGFIIGVISLIIGKIEIIALLIVTILVIFWILYLKWYSFFKNRSSETLKAGVKLPEFILEDPNGKELNSSSFIGSPSIFLFYRGNWCPLCMAQIKEIASRYKELEQLGVNMVFISPQPHKHSRTLAEKYDLGFHFLTDAGNRISKQFGIFSENGIPAGFQLLGYDSDTVMPTVIITDENGKIIYKDLTDNYRVRPEPDTFLKVIRGN